MSQMGQSRPLDTPLAVAALRFAPKSARGAINKQSAASANRDLTRRSKRHRYSISSLVVSSDGGEAPACSGIGVVGSTLRHRAGRDGHSEHLSDGRIVKPVLHFADGPSSGSCVTSGDIVLCKGPRTITLFSAFQDIFSRSEGRGGK